MADMGKRAFGFSGTWRDYAPIAFTNLLLTIATLGLYRFWATTRTRRYLWSHTRFVDEPLEWGGTGMELFIGFLLVLGLFGPPLLFLNFGVQALVLRGQATLAYSLGTIAFVVIFYLTGVARFRALRYRLSRSWWHGIRGGSDVKGWVYGWSYLWRSTLGWLSLGLLVPWSMTSLWNGRWSAMSYGPFAFEAQVRPGQVFKRFLLFYLLPFILMIALFGIALVGGPSLMGLSRGGGAPDVLGAMISAVLVFVVLYGLSGLVALLYYSKFFRVAVRGLSLKDLRFRFTARTSDWVELILVDLVLVIGTLGIGAIFLTYRHWKFFIDHLDATGEIHLSELTQSTTAAPGQGEGLADAFDMGAF